MNPAEQKKFILFLEVIFLIFVFSLFFKLGADALEKPVMRWIYAGLLGSGFLSLYLSGCCSYHKFKSPTLILLFSFLGFEWVRSLRAAYLLMRGISETSSLSLHRFLYSPVDWFLSLGFFLLAYLLYFKRDQAVRLLWVLAWGGFTVALAALPPLLIQGAGQSGYQEGSGYSYFPSFVYFHKGIDQYLVSRYAHTNYVGDIIAIGFFAAAGLLFYLLQRWLDKKKSEENGVPLPFSVLSLLGIFVGACALAIVLLFSRGTIICFALSFCLFFAVLAVKYFSRKQALTLAILFIVVAGFLIWAANLSLTWKEVMTAPKEFVFSKEQNSSLSTNREGAKRAIRIYRVFPVWGVGRRGYSAVSDLFATPGVKHYAMRKLKAFCHYLQVLAEEGAGAYLYFSFLLVYFFEILRGLIRTRSRFQFVAALSLSLPVILILSHAAIKPVMEYFAIATPVYLLMGASLAVLRRDFAHS